MEQLEIDIDLRMHEMIMDAFVVFEAGNMNAYALVSFLRASYGLGYVDALRDDKAGERGKLGTDHGYRLDL